MSFVTALRRCQVGYLSHISRKLWLSSPTLTTCSARHASTVPIQTENYIKYIRNIGIVAHVDAGKTTTTEQMLFNSGSLRHAGHVDHGDTVTDFLPMERQRGITIQSAAITFQWPKKDTETPDHRSHIINLIDTPGHVDFRFEVERCMPILDGAVCVMDGVEGVEAHTERVWASAREFGIPCIIFVNKLDRDGASFKKSVQDIGLKLNAMPLVCQIPYWKDDTVKGVVDVVTGRVVSWAGTSDSPEKLASIETKGPIQEEIARARERIVELLCDRDEELMNQWIDQGSDLPAEEIKKAIRRVLNNSHGTIVPVFAGSSLKNIGVVPLLNAVNDYLPSPQDRPVLRVRDNKGMKPLTDVIQESQERKKTRIDFLGSVFKVTHDPRRGMLAWVRVYHGALKKNATLWNTNLGKPEKPLNIMQISGAQHVEVPHLAPGQIGAMTGMKAARTGDTLISFSGPSSKALPDHLADVRVRPPEIPPAVAFIVPDVDTPTEAKALEEALENLSREDPSLRWTKDEKTQQYTLSGMGTLHLEVARDRLENYYKAKAHFGKIVVDYREGLSYPVGPIHAVFDKTVAGHTGSAECTATIEPLDEHTLAEMQQPKNSKQSLKDSSSLQFTERNGNIIRVEFADSLAPDPSSEKGTERSHHDLDAVRKQLTSGAIAALARGPRRGSALYRCKVTLQFNINGGVHGTGLLGAHVSGAARKAVKDALTEAYKQGQISILEPVMRATIVCPESAASAIEHDLQSTRGGTVLEVRDLQDTSSSSSSPAAPPSGDSSPTNTPPNFATTTQHTDPIDISEIYAPPDPYEFQKSLRETRKGRLRMLQITAKVPLAEVLEYDGVLRGKTSGHHTLTMSLDTFDRVTGPREKKISEF
ncbi:P-loop containing nucleoside triphosphate hydrolase protein [Xylariaceae sp. FL0255]|nr:P-loop containing nucleoside triphosphate hydrolase protein [Xylariaceae sp. FL0255]